ncbi:MAG TPA: hypothetical protein VFH24_07240 [Gemmatimonadales bacterium]|nr:hypothetical protein [Gemmatimonadales bacterium]
MPSYRVWLTVAAAVFLACESEPPPPTPPAFSKAFSHLPLPPNPEMVSRAGGADALQITVYSPSDTARVTDFYRTALTQGTWRLVSDIKSADGSTALYAEHDGPPLWVRIWKANDRPGTMVQLTGAVVAQDSSKPKKASDSTTPRATQRG